MNIERAPPYPPTQKYNKYENAKTSKINSDKNIG